MCRVMKLKYALCGHTRDCMSRECRGKAQNTKCQTFDNCYIEEECTACLFKDACKRENECQAQLKHIMWIIKDKVTADKDWTNLMRTLPSNSDQRVHSLINARSMLQNGAFLDCIHKILGGLRDLFTQEKSNAKAIKECRALLKNVNTLCWDHLKAELQISSHLVDLIRSPASADTAAEGATEKGYNVLEGSAASKEYDGPEESAALNGYNVPEGGVVSKEYDVPEGSAASHEDSDPEDVFSPLEVVTPEADAMEA